MKTVILSQKFKLILLGFSLVITSFCSPLTSYSQSITIKDSKFEKALIDLKLDKDGLNGSLKISDVDTVTRLVISNKGITDLTGIEAFKNLKVLNFRANKVSTVNLTKNKRLMELYCDSNQLLNLNISLNDTLNILNCSENLITAIDFGNIYKYYLFSFNLSGNKLKVIDFNYVRNVRFLNFSKNSLSYFIALNCPDLTELYCVGNQLVGLDFSHSKYLKVLDCRNNKLTNLNLQNDSNHLMTYLNSMGNPTLIRICVDSSIYAKQYFTNVDGVSKFFDTNCSTALVPDLNFEKTLVTQSIDFNGITGTIFNSDASVITSLNISNKDIIDITGIEAFESLVNFNCSLNNLWELNLESNPLIKYLDCSEADLQNITLKNNPELLSLNCYNNSINSLDLSKNPSLTYLNCEFNSLGTLSLTNNPKLKSLKCGSNKMSYLNISLCTLLDTLIFDNNAITNFRSDYFPALKFLNCSYNKLSNLDLSSNQLLTDLHCINNQISILNLTQNPNLTNLFCFRNELDALNVSQNPKLKQLFCDYNFIATLDISNNKVLTELNCKYNSLYKLNIRNGNNKNMTVCVSYYNDELKEICTDDAKYASTAFPQKPEGAVYLDGVCITSSIGNQILKNNIVYPNPCNGSFFIQSEIKVENLEIRNLIGQKVDFQSNEINNDLNVILNSPGVYILSYSSTSRHFKMKIISY